MSELRLAFPANVIAGRGRLTAQDVALLKEEMFPNGLEDAEGAVLLFALHNSCRPACPEWGEFFVDALTRFIVDGVQPEGRLDETNALWLERMLAADGIIATELELKLLMNVLATAASVPDSLRVFALSQLRYAIHSGLGAYAARRRGHQKGISAADIEFARTVVDAGAGDPGTASPAIHRVLLSIDAVAQPGMNDGTWLAFLYTTRTGHTDRPEKAHRATRRRIAA